MTAGYWRNPEPTTETSKKLWFRTGDLAYKDAEDLTIVFSRKSEIIKHQAGLVSPIEVEGFCINILLLEAAVFGDPQTDLGTMVEAKM